MKAVVAMSGGVDSSVSAFLLKEQGYDVIGVTFQLWENRGKRNDKICCSLESSEDAQRVCERLSIDHISIDVREEFAHSVIEDFCNSYVQGLTPNPCIACNQFIKFNVLLDRAEALGAKIIATGHYARTHHFYDRMLLLRGRDEKKDQSYVLYVLTQRELASVRFPVGEYTKEEIRHLAAHSGLGIENKPESQDICFVGTQDYGEFVSELYPETSQKGPIIDRKGTVIGEHQGIAFYTIGQRKGLGLAHGDPLYVIEIDSEKKTVIVGTRQEAFKKTITVSEVNWISGHAPEHQLWLTVKIRSTMKDVPARVIPLDTGDVQVVFDESQWAPAPGQSAVFYYKDIVIGGGKIVKE